MEAEVARRIRQHGRSSMKAEVCGVLIGREEGNTTLVDACIAGANAAQGGAHVTFTQDTWEHIYAVKDEKYPEERIVGWYHSHPGFGVFLSDHDEFIQQNFFSSPRQIAWVYDPHSDEEGCFGWDDKRIAKLDDVKLLFELPLGEVSKPDPDDEGQEIKLDGDQKERGRGWLEVVFNVATYLFIFVLGAILTLYLVPPRTYILTNRGLVRVYIDRAGNITIEDPLGTEIPVPKSNTTPAPGGPNAGKQ